MRTEGRTLLHVEEPSELARDQAQLDLARAHAAKYEIDLDFRFDAPPDAIKVGQRILDQILGAGAYELRPSGLSYRRYGETWIRTAEGGRSEILWSRHQGFGEALVIAKLDEWTRRGMGGHPLSLAGAGAELLRELIEQHETLMAHIPSQAKSPFKLTFELAHVVTDILAYYSRLGEEPGSSVGLAGHIAVGLALGPAVQSSAEWDALALGIDETTRGHLEAVRLESLADAVAMEAISKAPADWSGPAGFVKWMGLLGDSTETKQLVQLDAFATGTDHGQPTDTHGAGILEVDPLLARESKQAPLQAGQGSVADRSLFASVHEVLSPIAAKRAELEQTRQDVVQAIAGKGEARHQLELQLGQILSDEEKLAKAVVSVDGEIRQLADLQATRRARAFLEVLERGSRELASAEQRWKLVRADVDHAVEILKSDGRLSDDAQMLSEFQQMRDSGQLDQLPPTVRRGIESEAEAARSRLGPIVPNLRKTTAARFGATIPLVVTLGGGGSNVRLGLALPFAGAGSESLLPNSLEHSLAKALAVATQDVLDMLESEGTEVAVSHYSTETCSTLWIQAPSRLSHESIEAAAELYRIGVQESLDTSESLVRAEVGCDVQLLTEDDFGDLQEVMRLARA